MDTLAALVRSRAHRPEPALIDDATGEVVTGNELAGRVAARVRLLAAAGGLHTGDLGRLDGDGFVHISGRASELVIRGGENIYPREVEETLLGHPAIAEAAVVGAPDPLYGEVVWAFVAVRAEMSVDAAAVSRWCATRLADFKRPAEIVFLPELPKGPTGKVLKTPSVRSPATVLDKP
jgi:long-chain acyl-CoA synthetase